MNRWICKVALVIALSVLVFLGADCRWTYAGSGKGPRAGQEMHNRIGIVVFQFDDGTAGHYTHAFRILEKYKLKGSFGVVTGVLDKPGRLTRQQLVEMHNAGHEIHDHTLYHHAAFWGNPENQAQWPERSEESLGILKQIGINTRGWNQPGGKGQGWTEELRLTLSKHYDYAAGRVALRSEQVGNIHWHLKDDPLSLGRGGISSWGHNGGKGDPVKEVEAVKTRLADGIQQGLVTIPLWHVVKDQDRTAWGLEQICKLVRDNDLPTMVMADAVKAIQNPRDHFDKDIEQMPNPRFTCDIDQNGRPDGYTNCRYAPPEVQTPGNGRAAQFEHGTTTWIYGPEPGRTRFSFMARSADTTSRTITPVLTFIEVNDKYQYSPGEKHRCNSTPLGRKWQGLTFPVVVGRDVDRVKIEFHLEPRGEVYVSRASWRLAR